MTPDTTSKRGDLGTVEKAAGRHVIRFERPLAHPIEKVWGALTEPEQLAGWLAAADELELREGGRVALRWLNSGSREEWEEYGVILPDDFDPQAPEIVRGTVTAVDPPRLLEFDTDRHGIMRWELREEGSGSTLTFTNIPPEGFPEEMAAQVLSGWHQHLDALSEALAGHPMVDWDKWSLDEWAQIRDRYTEALG
jgi:uncharacterized protein YndB with AHSA1/START domain